MDKKNNKEIVCQRCGACCHVDMVAYAADEDFERWEKEGRQDIIKRIRDREVMWAGDRIISRCGRRLTTCYYLDWDGSAFFCKIYETRPLVCRNFIPGESELCPQYYRERSKTSGKE